MLGGNVGSLLYGDVSVMNANFNGCKKYNFQLKYFNYFRIFAQSIDFGYTLRQF